MNPRVALSIIPLGFALAVVVFLSFALLVPAIPCRGHGLEPGFPDMEPCLRCNGHGRSTLFQWWNNRQYEEQCDATWIVL